MQTSTRSKFAHSRAQYLGIAWATWECVCVCVRRYAYILSPAKFASSVNSNLNHVYQSQIISLDLMHMATSWTRMETTHGPTSSNDNSDGSYCMTTKTTSNWKCSEDAESAFVPDLHVALNTPSLKPAISPSSFPQQKPPCPSSHISTTSSHSASKTVSYASVLHPAKQSPPKFIPMKPSIPSLQNVRPPHSDHQAMCYS